MREIDYRTEYQDVLRKLFRKYRETFRKKKVGVLISGGIDSSIIAVKVKKHFRKQAVFLSLQSEKSIDDDFVDILGKHLKVNPVLVRVTREEVLEIEPKIRQILKEAEVIASPMQMALASVYYFLFKEAQSLGIEVVFTGQGPDVLLAGYHKYRGLNGADLKSEIFKDLALLEIDRKRDEGVAKYWHIGIASPYLTQKFVEYAISIPTRLLVKNGIPKYLSRIAGKDLGLPKIIVDRPKQAMQYSTGMQKLIK